MNMYEMLQKMSYNQSTDEQNNPLRLRRPSTCFNDDIFDRRRYSSQRRRSSFTAYELNDIKGKTLPKSQTTTTVNNRLATSQIQLGSSSSTSETGSFTGLQRRSTINRLNSLTNNESHNSRIQSNEYTSITDG
jgi:hypothetical protein